MSKLYDSRDRDFCLTQLMRMLWFTLLMVGLGLQARAAQPVDSLRHKAPGAEAPEEARHWAFIPPQKPEIPEVRLKNWPRNPIDFFILSRLEKAGIRPSRPADGVTLIRRLSLDLIGLPPTVEQIQQFLADDQPDAYERLVEQMLASPHFGERWGRHWLDLARYADSNGYSIDAPRSIWKYRDWVIDAVNRDLPFDQFMIEQLAGDLLPNPTIEQKIATGFHRNTQINQEGGIDKEQFRIESIVDRLATTGTAFLGLTIACAQCHDHKFDPITQRDYFQLFAFFNNSDEPALELPTPEEAAGRKAHRDKIVKMDRELEEYSDLLARRQAEWERNLSPEERQRLPQEIQAILTLDLEQRSPEQKQQLFEALRGQDPEFKERQSKLAKLKKEEPPITTTMIVQERAELRPTHIHIKGDFTRPGQRVAPDVPRVLHSFPPVERPNRLDLARWLADPNNPLTARVIVNRIWQQYFGRGIVETENDFGTQGSSPSHPELLDWLALEFIDQNWSVKPIHRLIVTSAAYRQDSRVRPELAATDPNNRLLARQSRLRLESEIIRDVALAASGLLSRKIGGPSVFPPQPDGVMTLGQSRREWNTSEGTDRYRRGLYTFFWRATPHPALMVFDSPDSFSACTRRNRSNTPLQALTLLNDQAFFECAEGLAARLLRQGPADDPGRIDFAFRLCLGRPPRADEMQRLQKLLIQQRALAETSKFHDSASAQPNDGELEAWTTVARVLFNLDETLTRE